MTTLDPAVQSLLKDPTALIPTIVQDFTSNEVLMLAYMTAESLALTLSSGKATYWSRSRNELWIKGATSGHFQKVHSIAVDCDGDALLIMVTQIGVACHTGNATCFHRPVAMGGQ
ncbi:MAG: phosphoribosyl-AMP cyclohydrolase [Actinomycetota bacterium]|nr:phosphoribosyl-AMP cyclohydrolase [Actinomycetota bacterium]